MATYSFDSGYNFSNNPFSNADTSSYNIGTTQSSSLDDLSKQFYNSLKNNNFADSLPKFNYDPKTGDEDVTAKNDRFRQQNREDLAYNQQLSNEDAEYKNNLAYRTDLERRNRDKADYFFKQSLDSTRALAEREANRPKTQTFSTQSTVDPNSREGQNIAMWQAQNSKMKAHDEAQSKGLDRYNEMTLLPARTQATIQTQAPQFASQEKVPSIGAEAQKAVALANQKASMYGSDATVKAADI
ncbi:MAG TPA: hypothetical protein V6C58_03580, partial [Allocoleopsis sp.]